MTEAPTTKKINVNKENPKFPIFNQLASREHEQVIICSDPAVGLKAIIAIHDTTLGPALGGTRMWNYESEEAALKDVLRLSRGMTYKSAISGLNLGGGKAVIIGDPHTQKTETLFRSFGRFVDGLGGRYITAEDVGMTEREMEWIYSETKYVTGIPKALGGSGNPSPVTAYGVYMGVKACAKKAYSTDSLQGKRIALQGAGNVASHFARYAAKEGAELFISDLYEEKAKSLANEVEAEVVEANAIYGLDVDIFTPCALGGVINDDTMDQFKCDIIAGAANNVLDEEDRHGQLLLEKGIIYAPDYVINAGGIINIASELEGYNEERALQKAGNIYSTILDILTYSEDNDMPAHKASNLLAEERIAKVGKINNVYSSKGSISGRLGEIYKRF
ncbi:MAG: Glu/Leu/Phe/Val dehydrogenase [Balneolaceae bacterium]